MKPSCDETGADPHREGRRQCLWMPAGRELGIMTVEERPVSCQIEWCGEKANSTWVRVESLSKSRVALDRKASGGRDVCPHHEVGEGQAFGLRVSTSIRWPNELTRIDGNGINPLYSRLDIPPFGQHTEVHNGASG